MKQFVKNYIALQTKLVISKYKFKKTLHLKNIRVEEMVKTV